MVIKVKKRLLFIYNPNAGKARISAKLSDIIVEFSQDGWEVIVLPTAKHGDAAEFAREYAAEGKIDRIVCSGGDGTLSEVVSGVLRSGRRMPVGYIPAGTTNDFGYSLKIPKEIMEAAWLAACGEPIPSDVGTINGNTFTYTAAFGLFSDVSYDTPQNMKNVLGRAAYILSGAKSLTNVKAYQLEVVYRECTGEGMEEGASHTETVLISAEDKTKETDEVSTGTGEEKDVKTVLVNAPETSLDTSPAENAGGRIPDGKTPLAVWENDCVSEAAMPEYTGFVPAADSSKKDSGGGRDGIKQQDEGVWRRTEGEFICGMISNSDSVGGFKGIMGKGVQFDDGVFEMLLIRRPRNLIELTETINDLLGKKLESDNIVYSHVNAVRLKTAGELPWSLDGEYGGDMPQAEIHILKQAADYIRYPGQEE